VQEADLQKNTLQVKVAIHDPAPELKPEMLARVRFSAAAAKIGAAGDASAAAAMGSHVLFVPEALVRRHGGQAAVWVVDRATSSAAMRHVELGGGRQDGWVSVAAGLSAGDLLVANPAGLSDGTKVRITGEADDVGAAAATNQGGSHGVH
jgi:multidrug efflux pump subunit AcrA (membrane-fusion protein)